MKVRIEGIVPLILHNGLLADPGYYYTVEKKKITAKRKKVEADQEEIGRLEFLGGLYTNKDGQVIIPARVLSGMIIKGAKGLKNGNAAKAGVFVEQDVPLIYEGPTNPEDLYKDKNFVLRMPVKQGQVTVIRVRPIFQKWAVEFDLAFAEEVVTKDDVKAMLEQAGRFCGLGDWRPQHGRFRVTKFE